VPCACVQILDALSMDLGLATLRSSTASLAALLFCLPVRLHALALRAHAPSIDARRALRVNRVDAATALAAVSAAAHLPCTLTALRFHARGISHRTLAAAFAAIGSLTSLVQLDMSGLCMGATGAISFAPHLLRLQSLEVRPGTPSHPACPGAA
jgi:hypothetical protein